MLLQPVREPPAQLVPSLLPLFPFLRVRAVHFPRALFVRAPPWPFARFVLGSLVHPIQDISIGQERADPLRRSPLHLPAIPHLAQAWRFALAAQAFLRNDQVLHSFAQPVARASA